jgi:hypothetical protein
MTPATRQLVTIRGREEKPGTTAEVSLQARRRLVVTVLLLDECECALGPIVYPLGPPSRRFRACPRASTGTPAFHARKEQPASLNAASAGLAVDRATAGALRATDPMCRRIRTPACGAISMSCGVAVSSCPVEIFPTLPVERDKPRRGRFDAIDARSHDPAIRSRLSLSASLAVRTRPRAEGERTLRTTPFEPRATRRGPGVTRSGAD